jgi:hypothetical protein
VKECEKEKRHVFRVRHLYGIIDERKEKEDNSEPYYNTGEFKKLL